MNKWQNAYSELKRLENMWKQSVQYEFTVKVVLSVLLMLVEEKLHEQQKTHETKSNTKNMD